MNRRQRVTVALWVAAGVPLAVGAVTGLALSYSNVVDVVTPIVGDETLARVFPLTWDVVLLGAALAYLATAYMGRPRQMWRVISQGGAVGTLVVNAAAAHDTKTLVVHLTGPLIWAALVEAGASQLRGKGAASTPEALGESVPLRLWVTAPVESARTWLRIARRVTGEQRAARVDVGLHQAAVEALRLAVPGRDGRRVRGIVRRQLRAGSLAPEAVLRSVGWLDPAQAEDPGQRVLRAALGAALGQEPDVVDDQGDPELDARVDALLAETDARCEHGNVLGFCAAVHAVPVEVEVVKPSSAPQTVPESVRATVAAAESERPHRVTLAAVEDPAEDGEAPDSDDPLMIAAHAVAIDLAKREQRLTRAALLDGLRERGHACGNTKAGQLLAQLRATESA